MGLTKDTVVEHAASIPTLQTSGPWNIKWTAQRTGGTTSRLWAIPEGAEGKNPTVFVEDLLKSFLPAAQFSPFFTVERAHRIPPVPGPPGSNPRTLIFQMLNFRDRDEVLREARKAWQLKFQNANLLFSPDYSVEAQKLRRSFDQVKTSLHAQNIKYSILFPARLRVQDGKTVRFFTSPRDAATWLEALPRHR